MRIDKLHIISQFKNLIDFKIDIDENAMETVLLGLNATGKSNFLEALVIIFRDIDLIYNYNKKIQPQFDYYIKYECRGKIIEIDFKKGAYTFKIGGEVNNSQFTKNVDSYLPKHIFIYYSGTSDRLKDLYIPHQKLYYEEIIKKDANLNQFDTIRRIFLVQNIHANFALIAFYLFSDQSDATLEFLHKELKIRDFGSALFMLKQPTWSQSKNKDDRFWGAKGLVRKFLDDLYDFSFAPIDDKARVSVSYKKNETQNRKYLFIKNLEDFKALIDAKYTNKIELFNALESIYISDLLHDVKIRVGKEFVDGELAMSELSEGEKQLLTVLGLLKFTKDDESLILLDEPDTHLNPMWKWKYLDYLDKVVKRKETTQIIFCSHDPLVIGNMDKSQIRLFKYNKENSRPHIEIPFISPKGLGVAGILTSDMFDLPTTLDSDTQKLLNERNSLLFKESNGALSAKDEIRLKELFQILKDLGFTHTFKDPLYSKFIVAYEQSLKEDKKNLKVSEPTNPSNSKAYELIKKIKKDDLH